MYTQNIEQKQKMANIKERQTCHAGLSHADVSCWLHDADSECILASLLCVCVYVCTRCQLFGGWYCRNTSFIVLCKFSMVDLLAGEYSQHLCITSYLYSTKGLEKKTEGGVAIMTHLSPPPSPCLSSPSHGLWAKHRLLKSLSLSEKLRQFQSVHTVVGYPSKVKDLPAHHTKGPLWE